MATLKSDEVINTLYGQTERLCLEMFAECIKEANRYGSEKWGVTLYNDRVRLVVGSLVVCTLWPSRMWFALDGSLRNSPDCTSLGDSDDWKWTPREHYRRVPSMSGYYSPSVGRVHAKTWQKIRKMHFALIREVASKFRKLRSSSKNAQSKAFVKFLREALNDPEIPSPRA